jgi:hypothetical protein
MAPSPSPNARRTPQKQEKSKAAAEKSENKPRSLDLGKTIGLYDTATVREKVRKWQTTGGGVLTPQDALVVDSDKEEKEEKEEKAVTAASTLKAASEADVKSATAPPIEIVDPPRIEIVEPPATPAKSAMSEKEPSSSPTKPRVVERKPMHNRLDADVRQASAPKKRVVSDGHWRVKRSPPKPPAPKPKPEKEKEKEKEKDLQYAWVRAPLLPRKPEQEPAPPKPKPQPKPIKVYTARPRTKSFNNSRSDETMEECSEDELHRTRSPATPRQNTPRRLSKPKIEKVSPRASRSDDDTSPKHVRTSQRRRKSVGPSGLDDPFSSPDENRKSREFPSRGSKHSPGETYNRRLRSRRRSLSPEGMPSRRRVGSGQDRRPSLQKSPAFDYSDDEDVKGRQRSYRAKKTRDDAHVSDEPTSPPTRRLSNHDDEAARRRSVFRDEYARYTPRETYSSERKRSSRKKSYIAQDNDRDLSFENQHVPEPGLETTPTAHSSRVEAWLTGTPDPIKNPAGESKHSKRSFSFEPLGRDMRAFTESTIDTESTITDPRDRQRSSSGRGSGSRNKDNRVKDNLDRGSRAMSEPLDMLDPEIEVEYSSTTSVPTLRRTGARRGSSSPTKERVLSPSPKQSVTESDVTSSVVSSSVDASAFDLPDVRMRNGSASLAAKRLFPSTGKRLSTIASVETFNTKVQQAPPSAVSEYSDGTAQPLEMPNNDQLATVPEDGALSTVSVAKSRTSLKRKLTTHADLISVLSMPASRSKSIVSARSIRTHRSRLETATIDDLMKELSSDESKYMRELRTLADGVIPVLLKCVFSKSEAAVAAGLFNRFPNSEKDAVADASKAIHDMGLAIQRLKSIHTRIPKENHFQFLIWAQSASNIYEKYVKAWRLGFQDVVVSLATEEEGSTVTTPKSVEGGAWDQGLPRNEDGYIVDGDGERVDVAFLLKRPLVRLKYLAKTLKVSDITFHLIASY